MTSVLPTLWEVQGASRSVRLMFLELPTPGTFPEPHGISQNIKQNIISVDLYSYYLAVFSVSRAEVIAAGALFPLSSMFPDL